MVIPGTNAVLFATNMGILGKYVLIGEKTAIEGAVRKVQSSQQLKLFSKEHNSLDSLF